MGPLSKYIGCMLGSALGDAIGELAFQYPAWDRLNREISERAVLRYTDDTAMAIGLAESIIHVGGIDQQHLGDTFRLNFEREPWRGYASGPPTIFFRVSQYRMSYVESAKELFGGSGSLGNGAAMRVAPIGLFYNHSEEDLYEHAARSASVTHAHPVGMDGAALQARAVALAVKLNPAALFPADDFIQKLVEFARSEEMRDKLKLMRVLLSRDLGPVEAASRLGKSVAVHESLPFALYSFIRNPESFNECLKCAVLHGGDRDTLGAMACAVSGAYLGENAIPEIWKGKLENRDLIEGLARQLAEQRLRLTAGH